MRAALLLAVLLAGCAAPGAFSAMRADARDLPCGVSIAVEPDTLRVGETARVKGGVRNCEATTLQWTETGCGFAPLLEGRWHVDGAARMLMCTAALYEQEIGPYGALVVTGAWNGTFEEQGAEGVAWRPAAPGSYTLSARAGGESAAVLVTIVE